MSRYVRTLLPTYQPGGLKAKVYPHWRDSPTFTKVCLSKEGVRCVRSFKLASDELLVELIKREGVNYVIALSLSTRALELLTNLGVKVLTGKFSTVEEALRKFKEGKLFLLTLNKVRIGGLPLDP
ncbi:MAG: hypothetical protein B6U69_03075 [Thermofilum sp. ex4484_15]|nr:MAG: hypothetical protein B6U69_03075 [Thermofilum sp. ex4484_15]